MDPNITYIWYFGKRYCSLTQHSLAISTHSCVETRAESYREQLLHCSPEAVYRPLLNRHCLSSYFVTNQILLLRRLMFSSSSSLKQLIVSSIKEVIDKIEWVTDAVKQWWLPKASLNEVDWHLRWIIDTMVACGEIRSAFRCLCDGDSERNYFIHR